MAVQISTTTTDKDKKWEPALEIHVTEKQPFDATTGSRLMTSTALCNIVNSVFRKVYKDYIGSTMDLTDMGDINTHLHFTKPQGVNPDDKRVFAFESLDAAAGVAGSNILQTLDALDARYRMQATNVNRKRSGRYKLTEYGRDGLARFFGLGLKKPHDPDCKQYIEPNWADPRYLTEEINPMNIYQAPTVVVSGIDIKEILREIYGDTDKFGGKVYYEAVPTMKSIYTPMVGGNSQTMLVNVMCLQETMVNQLLEEIGVNMGVSNIIRA